MNVILNDEMKEFGADQRIGVSFDQQDGGALGGLIEYDAIGAYAGAARHATKKRGVQSNQESGVARRGTDGPARHSRLLSLAWWTEPPPIPRRGLPLATNRLTRPPKRSPRRELLADSGSEPLGQRGPALQGTGRSNDPARCLGFFEGGLDDLRHSRQYQLTSHRTPDPIIDVPRLITRRSNRDLYLSYDSYLLE